jgi:hypothetical protein
MDINEQERINALRNDGLLIGIAGMSLLNGMHFSPFFDPFFVLMKGLGIGFFINSPLLLFYFTSLILSTASLIVAGVPAAVFERMTGREKSDIVSMSIWFGTALLLALPSLIGQTS